jgi:hypothetical protein
MPIALLIIGILFLTAAVRGTQQELFDTLRDDFTGPNNFIYWGLAFFIIGAIGYWKPAKPLSNAFMGLVVVVLFLSNRGFFNRFMEQIGSTQGGPTLSGIRGGPNAITGNSTITRNPPNTAGPGGISGPLSAQGHSEEGWLHWGARQFFQPGLTTVREAIGSIF